MVSPFESGFLKLRERACIEKRWQYSHRKFYIVAYFLSCSHFWFATEQEVLLADWQEVWHSPQPPFLADSQRFLELKVLILFIRTPHFVRKLIKLL